MLEKKGVSPVQCQTATNSGNSCGGGAASGGSTAGNTSQTSVTDNTNGLEPNILSQNRNSGSNGTNLSNLNNASINSTSSGPNTPTDKMGAISASQDFVAIKTEEQKTVPTNHCESKPNESQLRNNNNNNNINNNNNSIDSKHNISINRTNNAININNSNKCRDSALSCPTNGPLNGPLNGIRANSTSPMNILNEDKLSGYPSELAMPVPTGNLTMSGDVPPLPLMQQSMNMMRVRGPCPPNMGQCPPVGNHIGSHPHNNSGQIMANNMSGQKTSATMDSQYMQQQSQIFVFTTKQANIAADAVEKGIAPTIIDYHLSNPETKRQLEKYPIKPQMNRNNSSAVWLNSMAQRQGARGLKGIHPSVLKNSFGQPRGPMPGSPCVGGPCNNMHNASGLPSGPGPGGGGPNNWSNNGNMCSNPNASPNWSSLQQQPMFAQNFDSNQKFMNSGMGPNGPSNRPCAPFPSNVQNNPQMFNNSYNPGPGGPPQLTGSEIPDENLTPQQKQHREKKLEIIRKMQEQLCPEMMDSPPMGQMTRMPAPNQSINAPDFMMDQNNMCRNNMCSIGESEHMGGSDHNINNCMTPSSMMSTQNNNSSQFPPNPSSVPPNSGPEWPKGNYMDDRRRKSQNCGQGGHNNMCNASNSVPISHPSPLSQPSSALNSPSPCISQSPGSRIPPPPYNQGIRPHSSPHPSSPVTGSLPMPSPRMQSPADSSRQQFNSGGQSRMPHTSPSPATPSADSNSSIPGTGVHSPKPLPASSSQTSIPTSSTAVQNNSRTQTSTNVTNMRASTPSISAPLSSSPCPSNVKKLPNHMTKSMSQDCGPELLINSLSNSGSDQKPHPNDMSLMGPTIQNCSSPFMCKPEPALMPVPSPQQIQYLNTFEGQELTIQKQPNTSLRDADLISPAPDLDLGFSSEFGNSCQTFGSNERLHNFPMDNMNPRFSSNPQNHNIIGHQFDPNPRFMISDNNQRFSGPMFEGPNPRMPNHENQFRAQNMLCMPYGQMDNNMIRFNSPCDNQMGPRLRPNHPNHPNDMVSSRFPSHPNDNIQSSHQFNSPAMSPMSGEQINLMPFPSNQSTGAGGMSSVNFNQQMESSVSSTHLQNLQKMTPPFDIGPPNKVDQMMMSNGPIPHNHNPNNQLHPGSNGSMQPNMGPSMGSVPQSQRNNNFDPISSMAAMSESNVNNQMNAQNMMSGPPMNISGMQVSANGPPPGPPNMVNFNTSMSSMQGMHQSMTPDGNGMHSPYGMSPQMNPQISGGPQTVNNTYVNATMSIQQLNIQQSVSSPNFNPNMDQNHNMGPQSMPGPGISPPSGSMQMMQTNSSTKMGPNFGHRMGGPGSGPNFSGQQMNSPRGMNPMNFNPNPQMMQRCSVYNSANIQIKPDAPNTIQYLPPRQQNPNLSNRAPSLDFLQRCEPPLTNLGNKLPTHNLQYFPSNNTNMNNTQTMPLGSRMMAHNMPMAAGPGRPMNPSMMRAGNPNSGMMSAQQPMMNTGEMFGRPMGPNSLNGPPNAMFSNMKQSNAGPMSPVGVSPDAAQPLPPSMSHSYNSYKQSPFNAVPVPSDPNYAMQYHQFQQQLYATNTNRSSNSSANSNNGNNPRMPGNNFYNSSK